MLGNIRHEDFLGRVIHFIALFSGFISTFSIIMFLARTSRLKIKEVQERYLQELLIQKKQYEETEVQQNKEIRIFKHNINEHLTSISEFCKSKQCLEVLKYVNHLTNNLAEINSILEIKTGLNIIDANLYHLQCQYQHLDIKLKWEGLIPSEIQMSHSDVTDLFMNLLKNSFEAVSKMKEDKYISVCIRESDQFLYINIKNSHCGILKGDAGHFETTKLDRKNHGFGLHIIKNVVAKYDGKFEITVTKAEFEVDIIFKSSIYKNNNNTV